MSKEEKFYKALEDLFIGAKIEGDGGFVNLMRIKSSYYSKIREHLEKDIEEALEKYPKFREELFDKLYSFFSRYFTKSGSIYFNYTPFFQNVYDKVYTDDKDVILFWKTRMLYYVKTDRIFKNLKIEIEDKNETYQFFFDVSNLEYKKANEKRSLVYQFKKISSDGTIFFDVFYSEKGRQTKYDEIKKSLKEKGTKITDEVLDKAFSTFEAQSEVDYFINKNAKEFLQEQFKIWLYQYIYSEETEWPKERIDELQILKDIAFKIIDFIYQFEDELVRIWNKPKFVLNSNYVITLDRIAKRGGFEIIEKIQKHKNFNEQVKEWEELGILEKEPNDLLERTLTDPQLRKEYQFLPIDTKYFKDLELEILSLFDDLDQSLDGWLIKSENYQALNTILPKFREKVQTIYIDPPFNKEQDADYLYNVKYKDSSWITLLENRLQLAKDLLNEKGSIFTRCDYNGYMYVRLLMNEIFGEENFRNE
jgi:Adenine specific DNA methylase Mod